MGPLGPSEGRSSSVNGLPLGSGDCPPKSPFSGCLCGSPPFVSSVLRMSAGALLGESAAVGEDGLPRFRPAAHTTPDRVLREPGPAGADSRVLKDRDRLAAGEPHRSLDSPKAIGPGPAPASPGALFGGLLRYPELRAVAVDRGQGSGPGAEVPAESSMMGNAPANVSAVGEEASYSPRVGARPYSRQESSSAQRHSWWP
jgi:hypothetical protein